MNYAFSGAPARIRTADLLITNQLLYQLSYKGLSVFNMYLNIIKIFFYVDLYDEIQLKLNLIYLNFQYCDLFQFLLKNLCIFQCVV